MPDLITEHFCWCKSNEFWERKVAGGKGNTYTVLFCKTNRNSKYEYDYSCDCPAFLFGKGKYCKHIEAVKHERCQWNVEAACGSAAPTPANLKCPKCGGGLLVIKVGI